MTAARAALATAAFALAVFLLGAWTPTLIQTVHGDPAYTYSYHHVYLTGAVYGRDVIHTGGPWSILYFEDYHPRTYPLLLLASIGSALVVAWCLVRVARQDMRKLWIGAAYVVVSLGLFSAATDAQFAFVAAMTVLLLPDLRHRRPEPIHWALVSLCALAALMKSSFLVMGFVVCAALLLLEAGRARRAPWLSAGFLAALIGFHVLAGQPATALLDYVRLTFDLAAAYPEFLAEPGSPWELLGFVALAVPFLLVLVATEVRHAGAWGLVSAGAIAAVLFLAYKNGFVRQDGQHMIRPFIVLLPLAAAYVFRRCEALPVALADVVRPLRGDGVVSERARMRVVVVAGVTLCVIAGLFARHPSLYRGKLQRLQAQAEAVAEIVTAGFAPLERRHAAAVEDIRRRFPIADVNGSLAVFSSLQTVGLARPERYRVLPTTAAQLIWTPSLDRLNAEFLTAEDRPDFVLGQVGYTNRRSGLALVTHYEPAGDQDGLYLLRRARTPAEVTTEPVSSHLLRWGETLSVPAAGDALVWMRFTYRRTLLGRLVSLLYQPPLVYLTVTSGDEVLSRDLVGRQIAAVGVPLFPGRRTVEVFGSLAGSGLEVQQRAAPVTGVRLDIGREGDWVFQPREWPLWFEPEIRVVFERLHLHRGDRAPAASR